MNRAALRIPITNTVVGGQYTAEITIGSGRQVANVILDTGSSTLAVTLSAYDPSADTFLTTTTLAQDISYDTSTWTGPVVQTRVTMGAPRSISLNDTYLAVVVGQDRGGFGGADGILGLGYNHLNTAYDLSSLLREQGVRSARTWPWPFPVSNARAAVAQFGAFLQGGHVPHHDLPPYFTAARLKRLVKNKFAFYTLRSFPSFASRDRAQDPLNAGFFILGGGEEQEDLYRGKFLSVAVVDDLYYNTDLLAIQVGNQSKMAAAQLSPRYAKSLRSNSLVDSGTNAIYLTRDLFDGVIKALNALNPNFRRQAMAGSSGTGVRADELHLNRWPTITFVMRAPGGKSVRLACRPSTYWQVDFPNPGQAAFQILPTTTLQSYLGLPLMNNYYTVFDRSADAYGEIKFAPIRQPASPTVAPVLDPPPI